MIVARRPIANTLDANVQYIICCLTNNRSDVLKCNVVCSTTIPISNFCARRRKPGFPIQVRPKLSMSTVAQYSCDQTSRKERVNYYNLSTSRAFLRQPVSKVQCHVLQQLQSCISKQSDQTSNQDVEQNKKETLQ